MAGGWREKFLSWFREQKAYEQEPLERQPGRIEEMNHNILPRVRYHYPQKHRSQYAEVVDQKGKIYMQRKTANQRKPMASEDEQSSETEMTDVEKKQNRSDDENAPGLDRKPHHPVQQEREKFTGVNFQASDIPSPVYGFRERRNLFTQKTQDNSQREQIFEKEMPPVNTEERNQQIPERMQADNAVSVNNCDTDPDQMKPEPELEPYPHSDGHQDVSMRTETPNLDSQHEVSAPVEEPKEAEVTALTSEPEESLAETLQPHTFDETEPEQHQSSQNEVREPMGNPRRSAAVSDPKQEEQSPVNHQPEPYAASSAADTYTLTAADLPDKQAPVQTPKKAERMQRPSLQLLAEPAVPSDDDEDWIQEQREQLADTLEHFKVKAEVTGVTKGPAVTRFEVQPAPGVKVNKITKLSDDLKLNLAAKDIRIEAPIPGKSTVGIEIPNPTSTPVSLREMIENQDFQNSASPLTVALGLDITGTSILTDLQKMPHGLISGATGSGKSVCINSLLISLLYKATPDALKMVLIDPKVVELAPFKDIPHLATPVINDPKEASRALKWAVEEMERRYECFAEAQVRDLERYNRKMKETDQAAETMPYIVVVIDELADLMMASPQEVEDAICRIAQKARACGIHLVVATQRPSVDVITGLIKANIPTRIAFSVSSQADSRTILDRGGAEKLLGHGDMLFVENGAPQSVRVQGNFVSDEEIDRVTAFVRNEGTPDYLFEKETLQEEKADQGTDEDELFEDAGFFVFEQGTASTSSLQRHFRIGYNRAARLVDRMEACGMISEAQGSKSRQLLMSEDEFLQKVLKVEA